ncbi:histone deacetylase superfamily protein [Entophlyctis helioformis]|nr:histone deacetylase superfamily protein [Entophlyctis helioformis]
MLVVHAPRHALHHPPKEMVMGRFVDYREVPSRVFNILKAVKERSVGEVIEPVDHGIESILTVHSQEYIDYFQTAYEKWVAMGGNPDGVFPDTFAVRLPQIYRDLTDGGSGGRPGYFAYDMTAVIAQGTYEAAYDAAQAALTGADRLINEGRSGVFAISRPPGHHSSTDIAGGFCFFNNAAIAAEHLITKLKVGKVVVLDVDYHHGNGTQSIFYERANPMFASIHGAPDYPYFWGKAEETGAGAGKGFNINMPLSKGTQDAEYLAALDRVISEHIVPYGPNALVISLGVDTFAKDPVGGFQLTSDCFSEIGKRLARVGVPTLFILEGGYAVDEVGLNVTNVLLAFDTVAAASVAATEH